MDAQTWTERSEDLELRGMILSHFQVCNGYYNDALQSSVEDEDAESLRTKKASTETKLLRLESKMRGATLRVQWARVLRVDWLRDRAKDESLFEEMAKACVFSHEFVNDLVDFLLEQTREQVQHDKHVNYFYMKVVQDMGKHLQATAKEHVASGGCLQKAIAGPVRHFARLLGHVNFKLIEDYINEHISYWIGCRANLGSWLLLNVCLDIIPPSSSLDWMLLLSTCIDREVKRRPDRILPFNLFQALVDRVSFCDADRFDATQLLKYSVKSNDELEPDKVLYLIERAPVTISVWGLIGSSGEDDDSSVGPLQFEQAPLPALLDREPTTISLQLAEACIRACPQAAFVRHPWSSKTPLEMLQYTAAMEKELRAFLFNVLDIVYDMRTDSGATILHFLCNINAGEFEADRACESRLMDVIQHAASRFPLQWLSAVDTAMGTVVHVCCRSAVRESRQFRFPHYKIISSLLDLCPQLAGIPAANGLLPLHVLSFALITPALAHTMHNIVELHPMSLLARARATPTDPSKSCEPTEDDKLDDAIADDLFGFYNPLQIWSKVNARHLLSNPDPAKKKLFVKTLGHLLKRVARLGFMRNERKCFESSFFLHSALDADLSLEAMLFACPEFPLDWTMCNAQGELPLQRLVQREFSADLFEEFVDWCVRDNSVGFQRGTILADNAQGLFALHAAIHAHELWSRKACSKKFGIRNRQRTDYKILDALLLGSLELLLRRSPKNGLLPFEVAAHHRDCDLCFELLRRCPNAAMARRAATCATLADTEPVRKRHKNW